MATLQGLRSPAHPTTNPSAPLFTPMLSIRHLPRPPVVLAASSTGRPCLLSPPGAVLSFPFRPDSGLSSFAPVTDTPVAETQMGLPATQSHPSSRRRHTRPRSPRKVTMTRTPQRPWGSRRSPLHHSPHFYWVGLSAPQTCPIIVRIRKRHHFTTEFELLMLTQVGPPQRTRGH